jgi:capsule polysaccharide modification protein KpsS
MDLSFRRVYAGIRQRLLHSRNDHRLAKLALDVKQNSIKTDQAPVIFMGVSTRLQGMSLNAGFALLTKWSLQLQGVPVIQFACDSGMNHCMLGSILNQPLDKPPCEICTRQSKKMYIHSDIYWFDNQPSAVIFKETTHLSIRQLSEYVYNDIPFGSLVLPAIRWVLRCYHLPESDETKKLFIDYIMAAENISRQFQKLIDREKPQKIVVFNGMSFPEATARWVAQKQNIPVLTHEVGLQPFSAFFSYGDATAYPIQVDENFTLDDEQNTVLDQYLEQRFKGNFTMAGVRFWQNIRSLSDSFLNLSLRFKQIVPIFTNVIFDTSQSHANTVFEHMFDWLDQVLVIIQNHPETLFVIRAHPDEARPGKASKESVAEWAKLNRVDTLENVVFVDATEYFSSYELIQKSKFVMIYNSTIGLEATLLGAPVLCAGKSRFTQIDTVYFPKNKEEYISTFEKFLQEDVKLPENFVENARKFLYMQLFKVSIPFSSYLEEDHVWKGYVQLKDFNWQDLLPENSDSMRVITAGILKQTPFELEK